MALSNTTTRLRHTFRYPTDGEDSGPEALDEQEQESLIEALKTQNASSNNLTKSILLLLSILPLIPLLPLLIRGPRFPPLLALTSLLSTAFLTYSLEPAASILPSFAGIRSRLQQRRRRTTFLDQNPSPLETYLPVLALALAVLLPPTGYLAYVAGPSAAGEDVYRFAVAGVLPAAIYVVVLIAKRIMAEVDPEGELGSLRYGYKGA